MHHRVVKEDAGIAVFKGDTRSLDYSSSEAGNMPSSKGWPFEGLLLGLPGACASPYFSILRFPLQGSPKPVCPSAEVSDRGPGAKVSSRPA